MRSGGTGGGMLRWARWMLRRAGRVGRRAKASGSQIQIGGSVAEVVGHGLVEADFRDRFAVGWIEGGGLVEEEVSLGRSASGGNGWLQVGQFEVEEDRGDDGWVCEKRENSHLAATSRAEQWEYFVDACEEDGPTDASWVRRPGGLDGLLDGPLGGRQWRRALGVAIGCVGLGSADGHDGWAKCGVWGKHAVIAVSVDAWWWHKSSEAFEKLKRREQDLGAAVLDPPSAGTPASESGKGAGRPVSSGTRHRWAHGAAPARRVAWHST